MQPHDPWNSQQQQPQPQQWLAGPAAQPGWGGQQQRPAPAQVTPPSPDELMSGGHKAAVFPDQQFGHVVGGVIVEAPTTVQQRDFDSGQPKFYEDGNPMWQIVVAVQAVQASGEDDGIRAFYLKTQMKKAVQDAVRISGAARLEVGGTLQIRYVRDEPNSRGRGKPKKIYEARYTPPAGPAPATPAPAAPAAPLSAVAAHLPSGQTLPPGVASSEPPF
jgi:hypothetical protein